MCGICQGLESSGASPDTPSFIPAWKGEDGSRSGALFTPLCSPAFFFKKKLFITPPYQDQSLSSLQAAVVDSINVPLFLARPFSICNILVQWEKVVRRYTPSVSC